MILRLLLVLTLLCGTGVGAFVGVSEGADVRRSGTSTTGVITDCGGQFYNIKCYGAVEGASGAVNTPFIMAAYNAAGAAGGGIVLWPEGEFKHTELVFTSAHNKVITQGVGVGASRARYVSTGAGNIGWSITDQVEGGMRDITLYPDNQTTLKTGMQLKNTDKYELRNVTFGFSGNNWHDTTGESVGLIIDGHNYTAGHMLFVYADRPIRFHGHLANDFSTDMVLFSHLQLVCGAHPCMETANDASVGRIVIEGTNDFAGGTHLFKANTTAALRLLNFSNMHWESPSGTAGYMFDIEQATNIGQMWVFNNVSYGGTNTGPGGFRFRNANWITIKNFRASGVTTATALDIDSTVAGLTIENFIVASATPTFSTPGQHLVYDAVSTIGDIVLYRIYQPLAYQHPAILARTVDINGATDALITTGIRVGSGGLLTAAAQQAIIQVAAGPPVVRVDTVQGHTTGAGGRGTWRLALQDSAGGNQLNALDVNASGIFTRPEAAAPSSPSSSFGATWIDSTDHRFHDKNPSGTIGTTVVADTGASNNFLTAISAAGVISKAQPSAANLSNGTSGTGFVVLSTGATLITPNVGDASGIGFRSSSGTGFFGSPSVSTAVFAQVGTGTAIAASFGADGTTVGTVQLSAFEGDGGGQINIKWGPTRALTYDGFAFSAIGTHITTNGQHGYCTDCTIANPCAGGGNGAFVKRLNGINVCN